MKRVVGILFAVAVAGGIFWYRNKQSDDVDARVEAARDKLAKLVYAAKDANKYSDFLDSHVDAADRYAMDIAYSPRARRRAPQFDAKKYANAFGENIVRQAKAFKADDQALSLFVRQLQIDLEAAVTRGEFD
jgi:hypothetical protein